MRAIVTLFVFLVVGYVGSRKFVARAMGRFPFNGLLLTGVEFLLLGVVLGPHVLGLINQEVITDLKPVIYLTLGSIGLLVGIELPWGQLRKISGAVFRLLLQDAVSVVLLVSPAMYLIVGLVFPGVGQTDRFLVSSVLGVAAALNSPTIIAVVSRNLRSRGPFTNTIKITAALSPLLPLLFYGVVSTAIQPGFLGSGGVVQGLLWWISANALGLALGFLMVLFTREKCSDNEMLLLIAGTVLLVGGVCYFLQLSALYTGMVMGFVVGNLSTKRDQIFMEIHLVEKILFVAFLILVGAMLNVELARTTLVLVFYVFLRLLLKFFSTGKALMSFFPEFRAQGRMSGFAFTAQGGMATAVALDCTLVAVSELTDVVLATVVGAVVVNDILALVLTKRVLSRSGEVSKAPPGRTRLGG